MEPIYYKLVGKQAVACDPLEWSQALMDVGRRIARTEFVQHDDDVVVSTVFLGMDHSIVSHPDGPLIYETMVFGGRLHDYQARYSTWEEAEIGHDKMVKLCQA